MTTIKLKSGNAGQAHDKTAGKPPLRRADPAKRSRSVTDKAVTARPTPANREASVSDAADTLPAAVLPASEQPTSVAASAPASQRNHRFDGTPRHAKEYVDKSSTPDTRSPSERTVQKGEFKRDEYSRVPRQPAESRQLAEPRPPANPRQPANPRPPANSAVPANAGQPGNFGNRDTPRRGGKHRDGFEQGSFNKDRATNPMFNPAPQATDPDKPRLSKRMAELGLCSRREADEFISNGWVTVDGVVVDTLGSRIHPDAAIEISSEARQHQSETVTIIMNKPIGYVSGQAEDGYMPAVTLVHPDNEWHEDGHRDTTLPKFKRGHLQGLAPAGRLDIDSTGLLVFTQDGRVAKQLIGDNSTVEKEYLVRVDGILTEQGLKLLNFGLSLDGVELKSAKVSWQNEDQLRFVLREGRKRQIRRMCELVGLSVTGLKRVRIGSVSLGRLPLGQWRYLRLGERF